MRNNNSKDQVLELIQDYISCGKYVCGLLKEILRDTENIIGAYRTQGIPKEGYLEGGVYYNFHGVGCYFEIPNAHIDIDFGPNGRFDGFDLYRLKDFYYSMNKSEPKLTEDDLKVGFDELVSDEAIYNPKWSPSEHLFYLK